MNGVLSVWCSPEHVAFVRWQLACLYMDQIVMQGDGMSEQKKYETVLVVLAPYPNGDKFRTLNDFVVSGLASSMQWTGPTGSSGIVQGRC